MKPFTPNPDFNIELHCDKLAKSGTEHAHQRAFFAWLNHMQLTGAHPMARMCFAIPNGGKRDLVTAARLKVEGVKAGVPDILYPVPVPLFSGLFIEAKKQTVGVVSDAQEAWHVDLRACGYAVCVAYSWRGMAQAFSDYAKGTAPEVVYQ